MNPFIDSDVIDYVEEPDPEIVSVLLTEIKDYILDGNSWVEACEAFVDDIEVQIHLPDVYTLMATILEQVQLLVDRIEITS